MKIQIEKGDRFYLSLYDIECEVTTIYPDGDFRAARVTEKGYHSEEGGMLFYEKEKEQLRWISNSISIHSPTIK